MNTYEDPQEAIKAGSEALGPANHYPWYDPANDGLQRVAIREPGEHHRFLGISSEWNPLLIAASLTVLAIVLVMLVLMLLRATGLRKPKKQLGEPPLVSDAERIEALSFPVARRNLSLLEQARLFYQAGNHTQAMLYLFSHQLVELDRHQIVRLAKGKTNRQYLREIGQGRALGQLIDQALVAFEDAFFGHHDIDRERFETCWSRLPEFESLLVQPSALK
jgi:hypothetical protein